MTQVLVVDDDEATREALMVMLEDAGYAVLQVDDGLAALETLRTSPMPCVVLLDLDMPRLDGLGVLEALRADPALAARHAVVLLSAVNRARIDGTADVRAALSVPLLPKPFDMDALLDLVAQLAARLPQAS